MGFYSLGICGLSATELWENTVVLSYEILRDRVPSQQNVGFDKGVKNPKSIGTDTDAWVAQFSR